MTQAIDSNISNQTYIDDLKEIVPREIDRISKLVDSLLSLAKTNELELSIINLNDLLDGILKLQEQSFESKSIIVTKEYSQIPLIKADPGQLNQVFINLILNALAAMPNGGQLTVGTRRLEDKVIVEIADTGTGISAENIKDIFEPFFSTKQNGIGLGLAISHKIIQDHGGAIELESEIGQGTVFTLTLPISSKTQEKVHLRLDVA